MKHAGKDKQTIIERPVNEERERGEKDKSLRGQGKEEEVKRYGKEKEANICHMISGTAELARRRTIIVKANSATLHAPTLSSLSHALNKHALPHSSSYLFLLYLFFLPLTLLPYFLLFRSFFLFFFYFSWATLERQKNQKVLEFSRDSQNHNINREKEQEREGEGERGRQKKKEKGGREKKPREHTHIF